MASIVRVDPPTGAYEDPASWAGWHGRVVGVWQQKVGARRRRPRPLRPKTAPRSRQQSPIAPRSRPHPCQSHPQQQNAHSQELCAHEGTVRSPRRATVRTPPHALASCHLAPSLPTSTPPPPHTHAQGGTGKSATAFNLASALAATGARVLLADLDPQ